MDILQYVSGKRGKLSNDCANKNILTHDITKFILYFIKKHLFSIFQNLVFDF